MRVLRSSLYKLRSLLSPFALLFFLSMLESFFSLQLGRLDKLPPGTNYDDTLIIQILAHEARIQLHLIANSSMLRWPQPKFRGLRSLLKQQQSSNRPTARLRAWIDFNLSWRKFGIQCSRDHLGDSYLHFVSAQPDDTLLAPIFHLTAPKMSTPISSATYRCCQRAVRTQKRSLSSQCLRLSSTSSINQQRRRNNQSISRETRRWQSTDAAAASANPKITGIVDQISQLTLLETADLVASLKVCLSNLLIYARLLGFPATQLP